MSSSDKTPEQLQEAAMLILDKAMAMEVRLSADDSAYGLIYISQKLAKTSSYMEELGDLSMELVKISLEVSHRVGNLKSQLSLKERTFKSDPHYVNGDRNEKGAWLQGKLEVFRSEFEAWEMTHLY